MAEDPSMMNLAAEQMKNMDEKQFDQVKEMFAGGAGAGSAGNIPPASGDGTASLADFSDPSKMIAECVSASAVGVQ